MSTAQLRQVFERWRHDNDTLVLATVYDSAGSTYSKAGAQMLINGNGDFQGMLSGGCLEGDLAARARDVAAGAAPQTVTYDLSQNDDALWGLGVGCDGLMRIFLQPLSRDGDYQPLAAMLDAYSGDTMQAAATIIHSDHAGIAPAAVLVAKNGKPVYSDVSTAFEPVLLAALARAEQGGRSCFQRIEFEGAELQVLLALLRPIPRVLILGAGLDAEPVVRLVTELGWRATITDHRPAYIEKGNFAAAQSVNCVPAAEIGDRFDLDHFDAAIVMSHHLVTDETYLRQLAKTSMPYIGILGPPHRRQRLLDSLGSAADAIRDRLHGPAGMDINANGPASIALAIVAEMHGVLVKPGQY